MEKSGGVKSTNDNASEDPLLTEHREGNGQVSVCFERWYGTNSLGIE